MLGGDSYMRGNEAIALYQKDTTLQFIVTGGNQPEKIQALDTTMYEAELTRHWMVNEGVPVDHIVALTKSTSTREEASEVLVYCKEHHFKHVTILSSDYHLRRVRWVFEDLFTENNIQTRYHGAKADGFEKDSWWKNESGMIITNNEYIKLLYYLFTDK
ncbi:MAG: YdcF family protein [Flavobacteriales bacterium]